MISLDNGVTEMAIITDVSMGGSSMRDGGLELMVHRRVQVDDSRGVQEPLNETMCGCNDINAAYPSPGWYLIVGAMGRRPSPPRRGTAPIASPRQRQSVWDMD